MNDVLESSILDLLKDDSKFSAKIKELTDARDRADTAKREANAAIAESARLRTETTNFVNGKKAELSQKQIEHDAAAEEAAKRIQLGRDQMAEVQRISADVNKRESDLDIRERDLAAREKILKDTVAGITARQQALDKATDLIRRQQAHIRAMPQS